ncbi:hypothetical protein WJX73_005093 [Symbiochloris irregularis]|uniref:Uncharacterized protein n=1 Tax=Symbiochloris irregularis TaxID=706552 RepID=A0AAW1PY87_9CHLO
MFRVIHKGRQGVRDAQTKAEEKKEREQIQKGNWSNHHYVDLHGRVLAPEVTGDLGQLCPDLVRQLTIPEMQIDGRSSAACHLTPDQVSELDRAIVAAQELLSKAAVTVNNAEAKAGFSASSGDIAKTAIRGILPLSSFVTSGSTLDAKSAAAGLQCMQEAEQMLQTFSEQLQKILKQLDGAVSMDSVHQPLALTALLSAMAPGATVSLATTQHPVIQVLYRSEPVQNAGGGAVGRGGIRSMMPVHQLMKHTGMRDEQGRGMVRQTLHGTLNLARGTDRGMSSDQVQDRQVAVKMAHQVCIADRLEFMRLNEQTEKLRSWLVSKPYQPITQQLITEGEDVIQPTSDDSQQLITQD